MSQLRMFMNHLSGSAQYTLSHCLAEFWELVLCGSCGIIIVILSTHICVNYEKTSEEEEQWSEMIYLFAFKADEI